MIRDGKEGVGLITSQAMKLHPPKVATKQVTVGVG